MVVAQALSVLLASLTLAVLPCVVIFVLFADSFRSRLTLRPRRVRDEHPGPAEPEPVGPPLEQIAADLHRLDGARTASVEGSIRHNAATRAYDHRLGHACRALEIDEHLAELEGIDLELERLRVEARLAEAGFVLGSGTH